MPLYEYTCTHCKKDFELLRMLSERDQQCQCPHCQKTGKMPRKSSLVSSLSSSAGSQGSCGPTGSSFG